MSTADIALSIALALPCANRKTVAGLRFDSRTPHILCVVLSGLYRTRARVEIVYGNVETGEEWQSAGNERGRIGRSIAGAPTLIRSCASLGSEILLDWSILRIAETAGRSVLYSRFY